MRAMMVFAIAALLPQPALRACGQCTPGVIGGARARSAPSAEHHEGAGDEQGRARPIAGLGLAAAPRPRRRAMEFSEARGRARGSALGHFPVYKRRRGSSRAHNARAGAMVFRGHTRVRDAHADTRARGAP